MEKLTNRTTKKRPRNEQFPSIHIKNGWVAASKTRNYLLKDPILDWFEFCSSMNHKNYKKRYSQKSFTSFIMKKGIEFETEVWNEIKKKIPNYIDLTHFNQNYEESHKRTVDAIRKGIPIIYQGFLYDDDTQSYGIPDLIVKKSHVKYILDKNTNFDFNSIESEYVIIDIKYHTLSLKADGKQLLNQGSVPCYKGQLYIYSRGLSNILNKEVKKSYVLGRKWSFVSKGVKKSGESCFGTLGEIDYSHEKDLVESTLDAIKWYKNLWTNGHMWDINFENLENLPEEFFPNMSNTSDYPWTDEKKKIADKIGEITSVWMCRPQNRRIAHDKGIFSWKEKQFTSETMNLNKETKTGLIIDRILEVNKREDFSIKHAIPPPCLPSKIGDLNFFVDFETIGEVYDDFNTFPISNIGNKLFMIGVSWVNSSCEIEYIDFTSSGTSEKVLCDNFKMFVNFIHEKSKACSKPPIIYHWSHMEIIEFTKNLEKINDTDMNIKVQDWKFYDLLKYYKDDLGFSIKGCLDYKLKNLVNAMNDMKLIKCEWIDSIEDGVDASYKAYDCFKTGDLRNMNEIRKYNSVDCISLLKLFDYANSL